MEEGLVGVVLARYTRSGDVRNDVHYIVELRRDPRNIDEGGPAPMHQTSHER